MRISKRRQKVYTTLSAMTIAIGSMVPTTIPTIAYASARMVGDVNGDGKVDARDASMVLKACDGQGNLFIPEMDIDGDGKVTPYDASTVLCLYSVLSAGPNRLSSKTESSWNEKFKGIYFNVRNTQTLASDDNIVGRITTDEEFKVLMDCQNGWFLIITDKCFGYICKPGYEHLFEKVDRTTTTASSETTTQTTTSTTSSTQTTTTTTAASSTSNKWIEQYNGDYWCIYEEQDTLSKLEGFLFKGSQYEVVKRIPGTNWYIIKFGEIYGYILKSNPSLFETISMPGQTTTSQVTTTKQTTSKPQTTTSQVTTTTDQTTSSTTTKQTQTTAVTSTTAAVAVKWTEQFLGESWNIRSEENLNSYVRGYLDRGCVYEVVSFNSETGWYKIEYDGVIGYILKTDPTLFRVISKPTQNTTTAAEATTSETTTVELTTSETTTTELTTAVTATTAPLPPKTMANINNAINNAKINYPGIEIGCGVYSLDGKPVYEYNTEQAISAACTVKAAYADFVISECEKQNIDIFSERLTYYSWMYNDGSGNIKYDNPGSTYTIYTLIEKLLTISDNTAYNVLLQKFSLEDFQVFLDQIGGQQLWGLQYGSATVEQREHEWMSIWKHINSGSAYAHVLKDILGRVQYAYAAQGMTSNHIILHKSGWSYGNYTSCSDAGIFDNKYIVVILTQDYNTGVAHTEVVQQIGWAIEADVLN